MEDVKTAPSGLGKEPRAPRVYNKRDNDPPGAVYVGRGSPWGNPFIIGRHGSREQVIERFRCEVLPTLDVSSLRGRDLVCFCAPLACHADLLMEKANSRPLESGAAVLSALRGR